MAWALKFDGVNDIATFTEIILSGDYSITHEFIPTTTGNGIFLGNQANGSNWFGVFSGGLTFRPPDAQSTALPLPTAAVKYIAKASRVGSTVTVELFDANLVLLNSTTKTSTANYSISMFGDYTNNGNVRFNGKQLKTTIINGNGTTYIFDPTLSSHAAGIPILTDTVLGNNATGVNMPTDGSAWINLGGGITLAIDSLANSQTTKLINLLQHNTLQVANLNCSQSINQIIVSAIGAPVLSLATIANSASLDNIVLSQHSLVSINNLTISQLIAATNFNAIVVGYFKGAQSIFYPYNNKIRILNALTGKIRIAKGLNTHG